MAMFKTIRQTAALGILNDHQLRKMVAAGTCPGFKTGNRFMVNVSALVNMLDKKSMESIKNEPVYYAD